MSEREQGWETFATGLADMARELLAQDSVQATLDRIVTQAVRLVDDCDEAGIFTVRGHQVHTLAVTSDTVRQADQVQQDLAEGPCFDAVRDRQQAYRITDLAAPQPRWPHFAPRAHALGMGSMMGFLLFTDEDDLGALNLYGRKPAVFGPAAEQVGWILASHAAVAFSAARTHSQLEHALEARHEIGEAMGILMERHHISEDEAFEVLKKASQKHNVKLRDIARGVTRTGQAPD